MPSSDDDGKSITEKILSGAERLVIIVKSKEMRKHALIMFTIWLIVSLVYYGVTLGSENLK